MRRKPLKTRPGKLGNVLLLAVSIILTLLVLEAIFRLAGLGGPEIASVIGAYPEDVSEEGGYAFWENSSIIRDNGDFYADNRGAVFPKEKSSRRIVVLGDSVAYGWGTGSNESFASQLDSLLDDYEVVNLAEPGYSFIQERLMLEKYGFNFKPDIVVLSAFGNDVQTAKLRRSIMPGDPSIVVYQDFITVRVVLPLPEKVSDFLLRHSFFYRATNNLLGNMFNGGLPTIKYVSLGGYGEAVNLAALDETIRLCRAHGVRLVIAAFPGTKDDFNRGNYQNEGEYMFYQTLVQKAEVAGVEFIDLLDTFRGYDVADVRHDTNGHLNAHGNKIAAEAVAEIVLAKG